MCWACRGFLGLMNVDIVTDQTQEIALMQRVVAAYPGDASALVPDPSMVHGMEGMNHGGHAMPVATAAAEPSPVTPSPVRARPRRAVPAAATRADAGGHA
jgi:hypothetical protein